MTHRVVSSRGVFLASSFLLAVALRAIVGGHVETLDNDSKPDTVIEKGKTT